MRLTDIFKKLNIDVPTLFKQLTKTPKKIKKFASHQSYVDNACLQADLLYLPNDKGYKYLLTVVDTYDNNSDFEPLRNRTEKTIISAFKKIFKRKYINVPFFIQTDKGAEFSQQFTEYFKTLNVFHRAARVGRHNQQAPIERFNLAVGTVLMSAMLIEELKTSVESREWVKHVKKLRTLFNKYGLKKAPDVKKLGAPTSNERLINIGSFVLVKLEQPKDAVTGNKLIGKFRAGDLRFEREPRRVTDLFMKPGAPIMYKVEGYDNAFYPEELQTIDNEDEKYIVEKIVKKKKLKGLVQYLIKWQNFATKYNTWETRKKLIEDGFLNEIKKFEITLKKKKH